MQAIQTTLPLSQLDRFWANELGCEPSQLRTPGVHLVPCGQRQLQIFATPDGAVVIGRPDLLAHAEGVAVGALLDPAFWGARLGLPLESLAFYGPSSLSYVTPATFTPIEHPFVRLLRRRDAAEIARFARILQAREPDIFHAWAIGGRVTANERLWGGYLNGKIVAVGGVRLVHKRLVEVGINTLPRFRQQGWGSAVASAATAGGLALGPLVQWGAPLNNEPSMRIAAKLGYLPYAHQLWLSPPPR